MTKPDIPLIVAKADFLNQTSPLGLTTLYTPADSGMYRITIVMQDQGSGNAAGFTLSWADSTGAMSVGLNVDQASTGYSVVTKPFFAVSGTAIQIQAGFGYNFSYNLYTILEQL